MKAPQEVMLQNQRAVWCFGAVHLDTIAHAKIPLVVDTSTPASFHEGLGGVATNVANALSNLDVPTSLFGAIGEDAAGEIIRQHLKSTDIQCHLVPRMGYSTGRYTAFHEPDGKLNLACVQAQILETAEVDLVESWMAAASLTTGNEIWFVDANLPQNLINELVRHKGTNVLALDAVSLAKAPRLKTALPDCDFLFLNMSEAQAITGQTNNRDHASILGALHNLGAKAVIMTMGEDGLMLSDSCSKPQHLAAPPVKTVDVTGAGDALIAGTLAALSKGLELGAACRAGQRAAGIVLANTGATSAKLSWKDISHINQET